MASAGAYFPRAEQLPVEQPAPLWVEQLPAREHSVLYLRPALAFPMWRAALSARVRCPLTTGVVVAPHWQPNFRDIES